MHPWLTSNMDCVYCIFLGMALAQWELSTVMKINGCGTPSCATKIHYLLESDVLTFHKHFERLSNFSRRKWLLDYFISHSSDKETLFLVCGKVVCQKLWIATLGIGLTTFYSVRKMFAEGTVSLFSSSGSRSPLLKTNEALAWMDNYFMLVGDSMPNGMMIHLPSSLSKLSIYQRLVEEFKNRKKTEIVSQSQFFKLWESHFSNVVIPKVLCI